MATWEFLDLKKIAQEYVTQLGYGDDADRDWFHDTMCVYQDFAFDGELQAKERPRSGKNGKFYTPPATVKFEKAVATWGKRLFATPVAMPLRVTITLYDETHDEDLLRLNKFGMVYKTRGDVDNYAKAICDGLNGVAWRDDKQIVDLRVRRMYRDAPGFMMRVERWGLSGAEYTTLMRYVKFIQETA